MTKQTSGSLSIIPAAAVFDKGLGNADLRVLNALGAFADRSGRCWPATTTLAQKLGVSARRVRTCLRTLEAHRYIYTEHRPGQRSIYTLDRAPLNPGTLPSGVEPDPGTSASGGAEHELPGTPEHEVPPNGVTNGTNNNYAFAGKIIRLTQADFDKWTEAYPRIDLRAELQALDDWYDNNLTGGDRNKWFARCSQALAKKNRRVQAEATGANEEIRYNDGVY